MNREQLTTNFVSNNIDFDDKRIDLLFSYMDYTLETNEKFNLTAITNKEEFAEKMIYDSALVLSNNNLKGKKIIDVGTGAGYPGMVLKILEPEADMSLLDSTNKKINHLKNVTNELGLSLDTVCDRAEFFALANREKYDFATARAVASLSILLEMIIPMVKVGGYFLAMKGAGYEQEINDAKQAFKKLSCSIESIYECELPVSKEKRAIIRIRKDAPTNKKYPREYKEIKRLPL